MAGSSGNWFKGSGAGVKGKVFISNATIAKIAGVSTKDTAATKAAKSFLGGGSGAGLLDPSVLGGYIDKLGAQSQQPKGQAKTAPTPSAPKAKKGPKPPLPSKYAQLLKDKGLPALDERPKTTTGTVTVSSSPAGATTKATQEVPATIYGDSGLVITKSASGSGWFVTHADSGKGVAYKLGTKAEAEALAEALVASGVKLKGLDQDGAVASLKSNPQALNAIKLANWGQLKPKKATTADPTAALNAMLKEVAKQPAVAAAKATAKKAADQAAANANKPPTKSELKAMQKALSAGQAAKGQELTTAAKTFAKLMKRHNAKVTPTEAEKSFLGAYQGSSYKGINTAMWKGTIDPVTHAMSFPSDAYHQNFASALMSLSKQISAPFAFKTYRVANADHPLTAWAKNATMGMAYVNKGFDSSSLDPDFNPVAGGGATATKLIFNVPEGMKGIYLNGTPGFHSGIPSEMEWLIPANSSWAVSKVADINGVRTVTVDLIEQFGLDGAKMWP